MDAAIERLQRALKAIYRVDREIGRGGTAVVYLAQDLKHDRRVALKVFEPSFAGADWRQRFLREIRIIASLNHPHILPLLDSGEREGFLYYVSPFIAGESLRARVEREGPLPVDEVVELNGQIAAALEYAHRQGVIHRDVKPGNILLSEGGALLADFGIALAEEGAADQSLTRTWSIVGSAPYMSPEQGTGGVVDGRTDQYSLACAVYEALSGKPPFEAPTAMAALEAHRQVPIPDIRNARPEVSPGQALALRRAMAKVPTERYAGPTEFHRALSQPASTSFPSTRRGIAAGALVVLVAAAVGFGWMSTRQGTGGGGRVVVSSLAVLPFLNLGLAGEEFYADGMTDELISRLGGLEGVRVISRTSVMRFKGADEALGDIARKLGVDAVLEGSVLRDSNRVRITVRLVETKADRQLWAESFERDRKDILGVQSEVAEKVALAVHAEFSRASRPPASARAAEVDPQAYDAYLRGREHWNRRSRADMELAIEYYKRASNLDPDFARARGGLALTYAVMGVNENLPPTRSYPLARQAAEQALAMDETVAEAHLALGIVQTYFDWNWAGARKFYEQAVRYGGGDAAVHQWYAMYLESMRDFEHSTEVMERAIALDPLSPVILANGVRRNAIARRFERAHEILARVDALDPEFQMSRHFELELLQIEGRYPEVIARREQLEQKQAGAVSPLTQAMARGLRRGGERGYFEAIAEWLIEAQATAGDTTGAALSIAASYSKAGNADQAIRWLRPAIDQRDPGVVNLAAHPSWDGVRGDSRYQALVREVGIPVVTTR